jgi:hypothetical protein
MEGQAPFPGPGKLMGWLRLVAVRQTLVDVALSSRSPVATLPQVPEFQSHIQYIMKRPPANRVRVKLQGPSRQVGLMWSGTSDCNEMS